MVCTRLNPRYSQKCKPICHSLLCPLQPEKLTQHTDKKWEHILSRILQETTKKAGFIDSWWKLAKAWSILPRSMISLKTLTKILWCVCRSSLSYFHSILNFTVRQHLPMAEESMLRGKKWKKYCASLRSYNYLKNILIIL